MVVLMLAAIYVFAICGVTGILYVSVEWLEPNRRLALALKLLILAAAAAAIASQLIALASVWGAR